MTHVLLETSVTSSAAGARGTGRYLRAVLEANETLGNEVVQSAGKLGAGRLAEIVSLPERLRRVRRYPELLYHAPTPTFALPQRLVRRQVVTILDTIPLEMKEYTKTGLKSRFFFKLSAQAPSILTISQHAASRITELLGVEPERITVAAIPVNPAFHLDGPTDPAITGPYVAAIADLRYNDPHKRTNWLPLLAATLAKSGIQLVTAGHGTEDWDASVPGRTGLGFVSDERWAAILRGAAAFVNTSSFEGQGMPPIEAISCGTPVVSTANSAIPEMVGNAGILISDVTTDRSARQVEGELAEALLAICTDSALSKQLSNNCEAQIAHLPTSEHFANQIQRAYNLAEKCA